MEIKEGKKVVRLTRGTDDFAWFVFGVSGAVVLSLLTLYGIAKTGESDLWQPMMVPIVICLLVAIVARVQKQG